MTEEIEHPHVALKHELEKKILERAFDVESILRLHALSCIIETIKSLEHISPDLCYMTALEILQDVANYKGPK